jgi:hypothetical protein
MHLHKEDVKLVVISPRISLRRLRITRRMLKDFGLIILGKSIPIIYFFWIKFAILTESWRTGTNPLRNAVNNNHIASIVDDGPSRRILLINYFVGQVEELGAWVGIVTSTMPFRRPDMAVAALLALGGRDEPEVFVTDLTNDSAIEPIRNLVGIEWRNRITTKSTAKVSLFLKDTIIVYVEIIVRIRGGWVIRRARIISTNLWSYRNRL